MIPREKLDFWIKNKLNVLLEGKHGVGKTSIITDAFKRHGLNFAYMSAATMDPWVDFIGIPKEYSDEKGNRYLELVRPKSFADDSYDIIFVDEYNRAPAKLRNALMELIQFGSINGKRYSRLKSVWAAVNPDTEDNVYDVERIDPAQKDRFHIHYKIDYAPDTQYFTEKYGPELARSAISWWNSIPSAIRSEVSPRRLDYAMEIYSMGGDIRDCIHQGANVGKLITALEKGVPLDRLKSFYAAKNFEQCEKFLANENNFSDSIEWVKEDSTRIKDLVPLLSNERISNIITEDKVLNVIGPMFFQNEKIQKTLSSIIKLDSDKSLCEKIEDKIPTLKSDKWNTNLICINDKYNFSKKKTSPDIVQFLNEHYQKKTFNKTNQSELNSFIDTLLSLIGKDITLPEAEFIIQFVFIAATNMNPFPKERCIGLINFLLKTHKIDIRLKKEFKSIVNTMIEFLKIEEHVWVPNGR